MRYHLHTTSIVYKDPGAYSCFPDIASSQDGKLWVSFRRAGQFSLDALKQGHYDHVDPGARIALVHSKDGGRTWSPPAILPQFDPECGEQDPSITQLRDGTLMLNFFRWRVVPAEEQDRLGYPSYHLYSGAVADVEGPFILRSFDYGQAWEEQPVQVDSTPLARAGTSDSVLELADGSLLMGIYGADFGSSVCRAYAVRSRDHGRTWGEPALIAADPDRRISFEEPALAQTKDGRLIAMIRSGEPRNYQRLYRAFSDDGGITWKDLNETVMWGHPAHVLRLSDGRLLCSYGYRREPFGIRACLSDDNGLTWDIENEIVLRNDGASRDLGYPSSAQLRSGEIVTVYYIHNEDGIRHIAATIWTLGS